VLDRSASARLQSPSSDVVEPQPRTVSSDTGAPSAWDRLFMRPITWLEDLSLILQIAGVVCLCVGGLIGRYVLNADWKQVMAAKRADEAKYGRYVSRSSRLPSTSIDDSAIANPGTGAQPKADPAPRVFLRFDRGARAAASDALDSPSAWPEARLDNPSR